MIESQSAVPETCVNIRGGCSVVFPGRMLIGQGNEESMVISLKPIKQLMFTKSMKDWLLAEVRIS